MNDSDHGKSTLYRNGILALILASIALIVHNVFGQHGLLALRSERQESNTLQQKILQLKQENDQLGKENRALKADPEAIERLAREQMHLTKPGEKVYVLPDRPLAATPRPASEPGANPH